MNIARLDRWYAAKFHRSLQGRVTALLLRYPNIRPPNFISWEGERFTGADTTTKLGALSSALAQYHGNAIDAESVVYRLRKALDTHQGE